MSITGSNNPFACEPVVFANANSIVSLGTITREGNQFTFSVGFVWKINGVTYQNTAPVVLTIAEASTGFQRIDNALLNTSNTIELQQGLESATIALQPVAPDTNIILTSWNISGNEIEDTQTPIVGNQFVEKTDFNPYNSNVTGTDAIIPLDPNGYSEIRLTNTGLISIAGYDLSLILGNANAKSPYPGKPFIILNLTGHDVVIKKELPAADYPFYFSEETDLVFPNNHYIYASFDPSGFRVIFKSWVDLSQKADLVGGKVPASQLPSYVDDVLEGYFNGTNFYTDAGFTNLITPESDKIYIDLVTNSTYRWSGSAYVQIGGASENFKQSTWMFSDFVDENVNQRPFTGTGLLGGTKDAGIFSNTEGDCIGSHLIISGTSANGGYRYVLNTNPAFVGLLPVKGLCFFGIFKLITQSDARDRVIRIGFHNSTNHEVPTLGAYLEILGSTATFKTVTLTVETASSSVALTSGGLVSGIFYKILIEFISTTSVNCKLVDTSGNVVLNVNHTTNIPPVANRFGCGLVATITTAGSSHPIMAIDYMGVGRQKPNFLNNF